MELPERNTNAQHENNIEHHGGLKSIDDFENKYVRA